MSDDNKSPWEVCFVAKPVDGHGHIITDPDGGPIHMDPEKFEAFKAGLHVMYEGKTVAYLVGCDLAQNQDCTTLVLTIKNPRVTFTTLPTRKP